MPAAKPISSEAIPGTLVLTTEPKPKKVTSEAGTSSRRDILKSTALIGGASSIKVVIGIAKAKIAAVLLGPAGVGLAGAYDSLVGLISTFAGLGISNSAMRQVAAARGREDEARAALVISVLRAATLATGILGALVTLLFCYQFSQITFGDGKHSNDIALSAVAVFCLCISAGQMAILQALRRIRAIATVSILGPFAGMLASIPFFYFYGLNGVVPVLLVTAIASVAVSGFYVQAEGLRHTAIWSRDAYAELRALLPLGLAFLSSALMTTGAAYLVKIIIITNLGVEASGLYQAAWVLSSFHVDFILGSMSKDFFPRLAASSENAETCNRLVNEQTEISMALATPAVLGSIAFASLVIPIFYTSDFYAAGEILRWQSVGVLLRVACWPLAYILLAKGQTKLYFFYSLTAAACQVAFSWAFLHLFGLPGLGVAYIAMYAASLVVVYILARKSTLFRFSRQNVHLFAVSGACVGLVLAAFYLPGTAWRYLLQVVVVSCAALYCLLVLARAAEISSSKRVAVLVKKFRIQKIFALLRFR